jgi:hypothetical protein
MAYQFDFYERVRVVSDRPELAPIRGEIGAVVGRSESGSHCGYAVWIYKEQECWDVMESELEPTGESDSRESLYGGESVRIAVDEGGRGRVVSGPREDEAA